MKKTNVIAKYLTYVLLLIFFICIIGCGDTTTTTNTSNTTNATNNKTTHKSIRLSPYDKKVFSDDDGDKYILTFYPDDEDYATAGSIEVERLVKNGINYIDIYYKIYCHICGKECAHEMSTGIIGNKALCSGHCIYDGDDGGSLGTMNYAWIKIEHYKG